MEFVTEQKQNYLDQYPEQRLDFSSFCMQKFRLYETRSKFYMIGRDKGKTFWRVLKIDRLVPSDLNISGDLTSYSETECYELLRRIHEGNKSTGGLKFVTTCYGIIGFVKFLEPYYMLLITKRRKIGTICGHPIYAISKSQMIPVPHSTVRSKLAYSKDENRYKKLLCSLDLTKDFFFSYSYHVMRSLQKNVCDHNRTGQLLYDTMFVWNEFLTRGIRNTLNNTYWTVALVYGFFKQVNLCISGRNFILTLIARRSRHYAGTRYLKRGVNEKGRVANDVEAEQIVFEDSHAGCLQISSVVQNRGSIPLFWSQEASPINIKPDIILSKTDHDYEATRLHFENLVRRYGNPIIILNLIKTHERKPRETILCAEFVNAIRCINKNLKGENKLKYFQWDFNRHSRRSNALKVLIQLERIAAHALNFTGIFYHEVRKTLDLSHSGSGNLLPVNEDAINGETVLCSSGDSANVCMDVKAKKPLFQLGVLRTNCIDCLDRTNVAQYAYGLAALGQQLCAIGLKDSENIDPRDPLALDLMYIYEAMGDTLAFQYGGSAAHNKIFQRRRGQWKAATQSQELIRTLQRYYNNTYLDSNKQRTINLFLGHYQPQEGKAPIWELDSDQYCNVGKSEPFFADENVRPTFKRSHSDGNILCESVTNDTKFDREVLADKSRLEFSPKNSIRGSDFGASRKDQFSEDDNIYYNEHGDACNLSDVLDVLSSSGTSCEELLDRSDSVSSDSHANAVKPEMTTSATQSGSVKKERSQSGSELTKDAEFSESFIRWVMHGETFFQMMVT